MWKAFQRYRALDPEARRLFWQAATLLPLTSFSLRIRGFKKTQEQLQRNLSPISGREAGTQGGAETVEKTCRMVKAGVRYGVGHPTCLAESLVLWYLLQKQTIPARLRIGVRKSREKLEAHAWVEFEEAALNQVDEAHQHYAAFAAEFSDAPGEKP